MNVQTRILELTKTYSTEQDKRSFKRQITIKTLQAIFTQNNNVSFVARQSRLMNEMNTKCKSLFIHKTCKRWIS